jgi:uncharacterized protein (DUF2252 family)
MVRVLGTSVERVPIRDLQDVVYYRQVKEYTDQEYEASKDLRQALATSKLTLLEQRPMIRGEVQKTNGASVDIAAEVRAALRDAMPTSTPVDSAGIVRDLAPVIAEIVRQEMSRMSVTSGSFVGQAPVRTAPTFIDPSYVPTVTTEGMRSSIEATQTKVSSSSADESLAMLRRMQQ